MTEKRELRSIISRAMSERGDVRVEWGRREQRARYLWKIDQMESVANPPS